MEYPLPSFLPDKPNNVNASLDVEALRKMSVVAPSLFVPHWSEKKANLGLNCIFGVVVMIDKFNGLAQAAILRRQRLTDFLNQRSDIESLILVSAR